MSLITKALSGVRWTTFAMVTNVSFNIGYTAVMARLLTPAAFGLVAMAQIAIRFLSYFAQLGISPAIIQKPDLSPRDIRAALTLSVLVSSTLFGLMWALAPAASDFFGNPEIAPILRALASAFLVSGVSVVSLGILRRELKFKQLAIVEIAAYTIGYGVVGVGSALAGYGVWSLVFAVIGQEIVTLLVAYYLVRHPLNPLFSADELRHFLGFGSKYSVIGFLEFIGANVDALLIGRWYGDTILGLYNRAQLVVKLPMHHIGTAITKVLFPVLSSAQSDKQKIAQAFLIGWLFIGTIAASVSMSLVPAAADAVKTLLGEQWLEAIPIVRIAAFAVPFAFLTVVCGIVCDAQGLLLPKLVIQSVTLLTLGLSILVLKDDGITGFALAMVITEAIRLALYTALHLRRLPITVDAFLKVNAAVLFCSLSSAALVHIVSTSAHEHGIASWASLAIEIVAGAGTLILSSATAWLWLRKLAVFWSLRERFAILDRIERIYPAALIGRKPAA